MMLIEYDPLAGACADVSKDEADQHEARQE